jgi:hypothetical protein
MILPFFRQRANRAREILNYNQISASKTSRSLRGTFLAFGLFSFGRSLTFSHLFEILRALRQGKLVKMIHFTDSCFRIQSFPIAVQQILSHVEILHHFRSGGRRFLPKAFQPRSHAFAFLRSHLFNALNCFSNYLQSFRRCFEKEAQQIHLLFARSSSLSMPPLTSPVMIHGSRSVAFARLVLGDNFPQLSNGRACKKANEQDLTDG